jgi:DNA-binding NtrC family response regulator
MTSYFIVNRQQSLLLQKLGGEQMSRVLIVDADPVERNLLMRTLSDAGYDVLEAANSLEAVRIAKANEGNIHVAVIANPEANDIAVAITAIRRTLAVLVVAEPKAEIQFKSLAHTTKFALLRTPFSANVLLDKVRNLV